MFRTSNPAFRSGVFGPAQTWDDTNTGAGDDQRAEGVAIRDAVRRPGVMTLQGTINKSFFLLAICVITALVGWNLTIPVDNEGVLVGSRVSPMLITFGGVITGLIIAMITIRKPRRSMVTAPLYAAVEGVVVGGASAMYAMLTAKSGDHNALIPNYGLILNASMLTFGTFGAMLFAYKTRLIKPTRRFTAGLFAATGGIMFVYMLSLMMSLVGVHMPLLHSAGPMGIGISLFIVVIAALNLILDFDLIATGVRNGAPVWAEWYAGFSLLVTLVWLYLEILRLLALLNSRD